MSSLLLTLQKRIFVSNLGKRLVKGGIWVGIGKAGSAITGLLINALVTRILPPAEAGLYFVAMSVVLSLGVFAQLGLGRTAVYLLGEARGENNPYKIKGGIITILKVGFVGSCVSVLIYLIFGTQISSLFKALELQQITVWVAIAVFPFAVGELLSEIFRGLQDFASSEIFGGRGLLRGILLSLGLFFLLIYVHNSSSVKHVLFITIACGFITILTALLILYRRLRSIARSVTPSLSYVFENSWPVLAANIVQTINTQSPLWIVAALRLPGDAAIFGAVTKFVVVITMPTLLYRQMVAPFIAELNKQNRKNAIEQMMRTVANLTFGFALLIAIVLIFKSRAVLTTVYGEYYAAGTAALTIMILGGLVDVGTGPNGQLMLMTGYQKQFFAATLAAGVLSLIVTYVMVLKLGYIGAAIGVMTQSITANVLIAYIAYRLTGMRSWIGITRMMFKGFESIKAEILGDHNNE